MWRLVSLLLTVTLLAGCRSEEPVDLSQAKAGGEVAPPPPGAKMQPVPEGGQIFIPTEGGGFLIDRYEFPNKPGEKPATYTNLEMGAKACADAGKRLCTAAEWRRACLGPTGANRYAYAPTYKPGACHTDAALPSGHTSMMDPKDLVSASGAFPQCKTEEGVFDLVGNVEEWVLDDWRGVDGMLEGGAWYTYVGYADCTGRYSRQADFRVDPGRKVFSAGFRCCWSPDTPDKKAIAADATSRLDEARALSSPVKYNPGDEIDMGGGIFIDRYEYPNFSGVYAARAVSWKEASTLCGAAGKRLCEVWEWQQACAGEGDSDWPYGKEFSPGICAMQMARPSTAGEFPRCTSKVGAVDMVGGVWEWTATRLDAEGLSAHGEVLREIRGGSWFVDPLKGRCVPREGYPAAPEDAVFPDVGFRCCRGKVKEEGPLQPTFGKLKCPPTMVAIADYCIDTFEFPNTKGSTPRGNLDLAEARTWCRGRGLHLCTGDEWQRACAGPDHRRWPYGNVYGPDRCRDESRSRENSGGSAAPSGQFAGCATPEGIFDLSGNVWEWTEEPGGKGVIRGGGWNLSAGLGQCTTHFETNPTYKAPEIGARCCGSEAEIAALPH